MVIDTRSFSFSFTVLTHNFQVAQMYMVMKMQQQNTNSTEGVEVLENRPFEDDEFGKGQYTLKIYRLQSKAPTWLTAFAPADALVMQEEAWNAYPRCKSVIKCLYFTRFILTIETIHTAGCGLSDNVHGLTKEQLAIRQVEALDIASDYNDYWSYMIGASNFDFSQFQSAQTGRGPLLDGWQEQCYPVMTAYKLVTIDAPYWGFGSKLEQALLAGEKALFLESHRNCFGWIDEWYGLNVDMMRELEKQSDSSLNEKLGRPGLVANGEELDCS
ncbi:phosphatidylinositol transfer protein 2-like isoform X1 [Salvia hispanica]|uniref:phosphatidylinositol transfer protein 2-like isoform X1 n=1 Tax=Salvia hispanica TaxID=49212 RepID=UPI002009921F|nr:phosphatidylinositol transfer protein 2-like isoform X1 [Salvia hispanica]